MATLARWIFGSFSSTTFYTIDTHSHNSHQNCSTSTTRFHRVDGKKVGVSVPNAILCPSWSRHIKRLTVPLESGLKMAVNTSRESVDYLWLKIHIMFPNLDELIFLLRPDIKEAGYLVGDLNEIAITRDLPRLPLTVDGSLISDNVKLAIETTVTINAIAESHTVEMIMGHYNTFSIKFMRAKLASREN